MTVRTIETLVEMLAKSERARGELEAERDRALESLAEQTAKMLHPEEVSRAVLDMLRAMATGQKISAIKEYRTLTKSSLKQAKEDIELVTDKMENTA